MGQTQTQTAAQEIGKIIRDARIDKGFPTRASLVGSRPLKGKITQEGLRKIEQGERVPRFENLELIARTLGLSDKSVKKLERLALQTSIARATRQAGNVDVSFRIEGRPMKVMALPPKRKTEAFVRGAVEDLLKVVNKYGVLPEDLEHFRSHARDILLKKLSAA
jgi:transcriptional regulator with XRE-family HTH domain